MNTAIYTIFDNVACEAGPIFQAKNLLVASRYVKHLLEENPIINPSDYELVCLGTFDPDTLDFKVFSHDERSSISLASAVILGSDSKEFMEKNSTEENHKEFMKEYDIKEDD